MDKDSILAFAEELFERHGGTADLKALERAKWFSDTGDKANAEAWFQVTDKIRELQNGSWFGRSG